MNTAHHAFLFVTRLDQWAALLLGRPAPDSRSSESPVRHLDKGATTWIVRPRGCQVTCEAGTLWLCFDREPVDIVLEAGETHRCEKTTALSIHALSAGAVRVT